MFRILLKIIKFSILIVAILLLGQIKVGNSTLAENLHMRVDSLWETQKSKLDWLKIKAGVAGIYAMPTWLKNGVDNLGKKISGSFDDKSSAAPNLTENISAQDRRSLARILQKKP